MDASQWPQHQVGSLARTMEELQSSPNNMINSTNSRASQMVEKRARLEKEQNLNCPRCNSTNTKFCYYNNYSLTQPRYFCKTCRRYWTHGGSLRNVPVGGGSRKNKRSSSSSPSILASSSAAASMSNASTPIMPTTQIPDLNPPNTLPHLITAPQNPSKFLHAQDLNLAFPMGHEVINMNGDISHSTPNATTTTTTTTNSCGGGTGNSTRISALELLRGGIASRGSLNSYVPMPIPDPNSPLYPSGLPNLHEFKPNVGVFSSSHGDDNGNSSNIIGGARLLFPFADMNKLASSAKTAHHHPEVDVQSKGGNDHHQQHHHQHHHHHHQGSTGYWTGMLGGGTW